VKLGNSSIIFGFLLPRRIPVPDRVYLQTTPATVTVYKPVCVSGLEWLCTLCFCDKNEFGTRRVAYMAGCLVLVKDMMKKFHADTILRFSTWLQEILYAAR